MAVSHGSLAFQEQIDYFRGKVDLPTRSWTDIYTQEHDYAFVVAGANKRALLADLRSAVEKVIAAGGTLEQFRQDFDTVVERHGWQYNGGRGWRTRVIYETNLRQSYNAGREAQMADPALRKRRPYGLYRHGDSAHPRPQHLAWNGLVLPLDDPFWATHSPQNGWGCKCKKFMLSERDVERQGLKVGTAPAIEYEDQVIGMNSPNGPRTVRVPKGIDPGFEHAPGRSRLTDAVPPLRTVESLPRPSALLGLPSRAPANPLPAPRRASAGRLLPERAGSSDGVRLFLEEFGAAQQPAVFKDVIGDALVIGREMFSDAKGGASIAAMSRASEPLLVADAIKAPDEVWVRLEWHAEQLKAVMRRRYISRYLIEGEAVPALVVFEVGDDGWDAMVNFASGADQAEYLEQLRLGVRLYRRSE